MRKYIKKIATVVASLTMISLMGITAFGIEPYTLVGDPNLFGETNADSTEVGWNPTSEKQVFTAVPGMYGIYKYESKYVKASNDAELDDAERAIHRQFKILAEAQDMAWSYQMSFGNPDEAWDTDMTQFQIEGIKEGDYVVYLKPASGYVCVIQDSKALDILIRFHSKDRDPKNFVEPTLANIIKEGYDESDTGLEDVDYIEFVSKCQVAEGGSKIEKNTVENILKQSKKEKIKTDDEENVFSIMMKTLSTWISNIKIIGKKSYFLGINKLLNLL